MREWKVITLGVAGAKNGRRDVSVTTGEERMTDQL